MASAGGHWLKIAGGPLAGTKFVPRGESLQAMVTEALTESVPSTTKTAFTLQDKDWGFVTPGGDYLVSKGSGDWDIHEIWAIQAAEKLNLNLGENHQGLDAMFDAGFARYRFKAGSSAFGKPALDIEFTKMTKATKVALGDLIARFPNISVSYDWRTPDNKATKKFSIADTDGFVKTFGIPTGG